MQTIDMMNDPKQNTPTIQPASQLNQPGPNHEEVDKTKIDPVTETHIDPQDDGDGEAG